MARPVGQFDATKNKLFDEVRRLAGLGVCFATTGYLARRLGRGERQVHRYLLALQKERKIEVLTSKPVRDGKSGRFYRKRVIRVAAHLGGVVRTGKRFVFDPEVWGESEEILPHATEDTRLESAVARLHEAERARAEALEALDAQDPDRDEIAAIFSQLQAEYAAAGIYME